MAKQLDLLTGEVLPPDVARRPGRHAVTSSGWPAPENPPPYKSWDESGPVNPKRPKPGEQLGSRYTSVSTPMQYTRRQPLSGTDLKYLEEIAQYPVVRSAVDFRVSAVFWPQWQIVSRNQVDRYAPLDERVMRCLAMQIEDLLDGGLDVTLKGLLRNAIEYGLAFGEMAYEPRHYGQGLSRIKTRVPTYVQLYADAADNLERFQWQGQGAWAVQGGLLKYIVAPYPYLRNGNLYGESDLASIAHDVKVLQAIEEYQVRGVQGTLVRAILHYYSPGESDESLSAKIANIVNLQSGGVLSIPKANTDQAGADDRYPDEVKVLEDRANSEALKQLVPLIERLEKRITRVLGVPDNLGLSTTGAGSYAKAEVEMNVSLARIAQDQRFLEFITTKQIIPAMLRYNFEVLPDDYVAPGLTFESTSAGWQSDDFDRILQLLDKGLISREDAQEKLGVELFTPQEAETEQSENWTLEDAAAIAQLVQIGILDPAEAREKLGFAPPETAPATAQPISEAQMSATMAKFSRRPRPAQGIRRPAPIRGPKRFAL